MKPIKLKEKIYSDKKRKLRRTHSLNMGNVETDLFTINENKKIRFKKRKSHNSLVQFKFLMKESIISAKLTRPHEFFTNNNNNNKIYVKKN